VFTVPMNTYQNAGQLLATFFFVFVSLVTAAADAATTWNYPGTTAPCTFTLQHCINHIAAGDTIQLASNADIAEFVTVDKSLFIEPESDIMPTIQGIAVTASTTDVDVTIRGIKATFWIEGMLNAGGGNLTLRVIDNVIESTQSESAAIQMHDSGTGDAVYGTKTAIIIGNVISQQGNGGLCKDAIGVSALSAAMNATIAGNTITATDLAVCSGIRASVSGTAALDVLIDQNEIAGENFNGGIVLDSSANMQRDDQASGVLTASVSNNRVSGQNANDATDGALLIVANGRNAEVNARIFDNELIDGKGGIHTYNRTDLGARILLGLHDNVFVNNDGNELVQTNDTPDRVWQAACNAGSEISGSAKHCQTTRVSLVDINAVIPVAEISVSVGNAKTDTASLRDLFPPALANAQRERSSQYWQLLGALMLLAGSGVLMWRKWRPLPRN
jgi:hypothetical protein